MAQNLNVGKIFNVIGKEAKGTADNFMAEDKFYARKISEAIKGLTIPKVVNAVKTAGTAWKNLPANLKAPEKSKMAVKFPRNANPSYVSSKKRKLRSMGVEGVN